MRTYFLYDGHEIVVERGLTNMQFSIDNQVIECVEGLFKKDHDKVFQATVKDSNNQDHSIKIEYKSGGLQHFCGTLTFWYDGQKKEIRSTT